MSVRAAGRVKLNIHLNVIFWKYVFDLCLFLADVTTVNCDFTDRGGTVCPLSGLNDQDAQTLRRKQRI